ncbi:MAG: DNA repair protein RecO [Thiobacillaceae bacterium]|nr:DNA repair protein RecO [Thiobacillaceae bacterium]MCX7673560.1 DNA repair protein RecO [Thiobacillaceae bacterium]MDW8323409.1 DNA repair protein RecO [Burkholderiales bacterium]
MRRVEHEPAYVLHSHPWKESSLVVDAFTRGHGRVGLIARGARRPTSGLRARLLGFQPLSLSYSGRGALKTLIAAEWQGGGADLGGRGLICGFYVNELLLRLLPPEDAHPALFDHYQQTLRELALCSDVEPVLRRFELGLLRELGYAQTLDRTADGVPIEADQRYAYVFGQGLVPNQGPGPGYSGKALLDLAAGDYTDARTLAEGKQLMRTLIAHYLGDKPLHTRQLLLDLQDL